MMGLWEEEVNDEFADVLINGQERGHLKSKVFLRKYDVRL